MISPLTAQNIDRLEALLERMGEDVMELESVDGFFCALACSPEVIAPNEYLPIIFGGELQVEDEDILEETIELIFSYWNAINIKLNKTIKEPKEIYFPYCLKDREGNDIDGRIWAMGFMVGVSIFFEPWQKFLENEDTAQFLVPMTIFAGQGHKEPDLRADLIPEDKQEPLLAMMFYSLCEIYDFFREERKHSYKKKGFAKQSHRVQRTFHMGRNDPCHCGSGIKFKKCCLNKQPERVH